MNIFVRQERPEDQENVFALVKSAFETAEHTDHNEHHLVNRLRKSGAFLPELSLAAEKDGELAGYILFTALEAGGRTLLALAPLAVSPAYQKQGIGSLLVREGHRIAAELGYPGSVVLGSETYYPRFGYRPASLYGILPPFEAPDENFMALPLQEKGLEGISGTVEYAREFFPAE